MRTIIIPPVCVLPTLAGAKLYTASRALKSNIDCIPYNVSRKISKFKSSKKDKKENKEEQASSENKTETKTDGIKVETVTETATDGSKVETKKESETKTAGKQVDVATVSAKGVNSNMILEKLQLRY